MIIAILVWLGLCFGSFVNALVWRLHEQTKPVKKRAASARELSISKGRSMCPHCKHTLAWYDLLPVISWLNVRGKCRYCKKPISPQYPLVELLTAGLFVSSYLLWPTTITGVNAVLFAGWLFILTGLVALMVYDVKWYILPDRIVLPLALLATVLAAISVINSAEPLRDAVNIVLAVSIGGGIFYLLFQVSKGKWIGGGDVKLGWLLGLIVATPGHSFLMLFLAALLGTLVSLPLLALKRLKRSSVIPFGPFLIIAAIIVLLLGDPILSWYRDLIMFTAV